jgi:LuxR family quorum-sensing transcriptional regulator LasR
MLGQFIEAMSPLLQATDEEAWFHALSALASQYGFDYTLIAVLPRRGMRLRDAYQRSNYVPDWRRTYDERAFFRIDPTVSHCLAKTAPLIWSSSLFADDAQQEMHEEARRYGVHTGISLPIHGPKQEVGMLCCVCGERASRDLVGHIQRYLPMLTLLRDVAFETGQRFLDGYAEALLPKLTPREHESLKWTAEGKSTWEIAKIFGCSESTVNFHMGNIRAKFGVTSRKAAAVKAIRMGLIDPD